MKIKPVDNINFGAHLPQKQKDEALAYNATRVDKMRVVDGLCEIKDVLACMEDCFRPTRTVSKLDNAYYQEVIESAKDYLLEN